MSSREHEGRLSKIASTMESLLLDGSSRQVRVMLTGMKGAGKTHFRQALFHEMGDERLKEKFNELERKRQKNDGIARTVITLNDRNSVDIAYKRFEEEEYEWEEKSVKVHFVEPDMDMRSEKDIMNMIQHVDAIAIFLDASSTKSLEDFSAWTWIPFHEKLDQVPPLLIVYNKKDCGVPKKSAPATAVDKMRARSQIKYDQIISKTKYQILELEVANVTSEENREALVNALIRQGTLSAALEMPKPNPRVVQDLSTIPKRGVEVS